VLVWRLIDLGSSCSHPKPIGEEKKMSVSFAKDIQPMFRQIDIDHMKKFSVLLDDYQYMSDPANNYGNAQEVEDTLANQSMPPGGPYWSDQQLALYRQWRSDGYQP
jgi:hypothetical protein